MLCNQYIVDILSQWIEGLKSSYVVCKAKWSRIESLLSCKHFLGDSSLFCLMFQFHIVICHHSTMPLEHMQRIWGWLHLEKCFFYTTWTRQRKCMYERIVRDVSLILNEFTVTPLWYLWNIYFKQQFKASIEQFYIFLIMLLKDNTNSCTVVPLRILQVICPNNLDVECWQAIFLSRFQRGLA